MSQFGFETANTSDKDVKLPERLKPENAPKLKGKAYVRARIDPSPSDASLPQKSVSVQCTLKEEEDKRRAYALAEEYGLLTRETPPSKDATGPSAMHRPHSAPAIPYLRTAWLLAISPAMHV